MLAGSTGKHIANRAGFGRPSARPEHHAVALAAVAFRAMEN